MQCESESDGERQKESESPSESESESESECKSESETESEGESASESESERGAQRRENFAEKNFAMLDGVTCFHCYLARAARRKNLARSTRSPCDEKFATSIFLVRGYGASFLAENNFTSDVLSGATGQDFCPGLRGKIFGGKKLRKR